MIDRESLFDLRSHLYIDLEKLESIAVDYDNYYDVYEMQYEVKRLKEAILNFRKWLKVNMDNINDMIDNYKKENHKPQTVDYIDTDEVNNE